MIMPISGYTQLEIDFTTPEEKKVEEIVEKKVEEVVREVKKGRRVLLTKSPGREEPESNAPRTYMPFDEATMSDIRAHLETELGKQFADGTLSNPFDYQPE